MVVDGLLYLAITIGPPFLGALFLAAGLRSTKISEPRRFVVTVAGAMVVGAVLSISGLAEVEDTKLVLAIWMLACACLGAVAFLLMRFAGRRRIRRVSSHVAVNLRRRFQEVIATARANKSDGACQPRLCRGRRFGVRAMASTRG